MTEKKVFENLKKLDVDTYTPTSKLAILLFEKGVRGGGVPYTFADQLLRLGSKEAVLVRLDMEPRLDNLDKLVILKLIAQLKGDLC